MLTRREIAERVRHCLGMLHPRRTSNGTIVKVEVVDSLGKRDSFDDRFHVCVSYWATLSAADLADLEPEPLIDLLLERIPIERMRPAPSPEEAEDASSVCVRLDDPRLRPTACLKEEP